MTRVSAPYNFVPLSDRIVLAKDLDDNLTDLPSQDALQPVADGEEPLSGRIDFTLTCPKGMPILVWNGRDEPSGRAFMTTPGDGCPVIPGSSLRGMVRNVLEIACFSRMALVDDQRTSLRDLQLTAALDYRDKLRNVQAGWLSRSGSGLSIRHCEVAKIKHQSFDDAGETSRFRAHIKNWFDHGSNFAQANAVRGFDYPKKDLNGEDFDLSNAAAVEALFREKRRVDRDASLEAELQVTKQERGLPEATFESLDVKGTIVFTGLPSETKLREFFFFGTNGPDLSIDDTCWTKFIDVHESQEKPSKTWEWRRAQLERGDEIPVFYLESEGVVTDIGLARMFKLGADWTVHDMIGHTNPEHLKAESNDLDLATRIFGRAPGPRGGQKGFRTRVSFGWATLDNPDDADERLHATTLAKPKPGFAPSYVRQRDFAPFGGETLVRGQIQRPNKDTPDRIVAQYRSYMSWDGQEDEIRGWKRYPSRTDPEKPNGLSAKTDNSTSILRPHVGNADLTFSGAIHYHNLHPLELGALLWALRFGGSSEQRHALGNGKPLGWGQVFFTLDETSTHTAQFGNLMIGFKEAMNAHRAFRDEPGQWLGSMQIRSLLAMATPAAADGDLLQQMILNPDSKDSKDDDFRDARNAGSFLPEYLPQSQWTERYVDRLLSDPDRVKANASERQVLAQKKRGAVALFRSQWTPADPSALQAHLVAAAPPEPDTTPPAPQPSVEPDPQPEPEQPLPEPPVPEAAFGPGTRVRLVTDRNHIYRITANPSRRAGDGFVDLVPVTPGALFLPYASLDQITPVEEQ